MEFEGTGCITASGVALADIDEDDHTDADVDAAIERLSEEDAAKIMQEILAADGLHFPRLFDKAIDKRKAEEAARSTFEGTSCVSGGKSVLVNDGSGDDGTHATVEAHQTFSEALHLRISIPDPNTKGWAGNAASSCRASDEGVNSSRCFQTSSSAILLKSSPPPVDSTPPTRTSDVPPLTCLASLDNKPPMTPPPPPSPSSPPLSPPPSPPPPERLDFPGEGDDVLEDERLNRFADLPPNAATNHNTPSSPPSPPPPPPPPLPPLVVQKLPMPSPQRDIPGALQTLEGSTHVPATRNDAPSLTPPPPVVERLAMPRTPAQAFKAPLPPPPPSPPVLQTPPPPTPSLSSFNPLKGMFSSELDIHSLASSLGDVLYRGGVLPVLAKSHQALIAAGRGEATSGMMKAIIRGMQSSHGKTNLARDNGGAKFVGPKTRTPTYKTGKGLYRLLSEISQRHEIGTKFVVCLDSPGPDTRAHVITGVVSQIETPLSIETEVDSAWGLPVPLSSTEALINGDGGYMTVDLWVGVNGDIREGQRLSAWVY